MESLSVTDTIAAISTPAGTGGIAVVRISGPDAIRIASGITKGNTLTAASSHTAHLVEIREEDREDSPLLDQAVAVVYRAPRSFTGEDTVELSVHGSQYIQQSLLRRLIDAGCRPAEPGEFTRRAFLNGRLDLAQAESIADLIEASSRAAHQVAISQLRGGFSHRLAELRERLIDFASLLELELDFSEEDVEFANRAALTQLCREVKREVDTLADSFHAGNAFKNGVPVAIVGQPNAGKSTLLNHLLGEEKAIVTPIAGTTRDTIEDTLTISGITLRLIDTAGLRDTTDEIEQLGILRTRTALEKASIVLWLIDSSDDIAMQATPMREYLAEKPARQTLICVLTKTDLHAVDRAELALLPKDTIAICAPSGEGISSLMQALTAAAASGYDPERQLIVTNARHYAALRSASADLEETLEGLRAGISADFIAQSSRHAIASLGAITGTITTTDLLQTIFSRFCIGK